MTPDTRESTDPEPVTIVKAGAAIVREKRVLLVRKRDQSSPAYIMVGGKLEPGEAPEDALRREVLEELGVTVTSCEPIGTFYDVAELEKTPIIMYAYLVHVQGEPAPLREIAEIAWASDHDLEGMCLASVLRNDIVPILRERRQI